jgi:hypothetical protein
MKRQRLTQSRAALALLVLGGGCAGGSSAPSTTVAALSATEAARVQAYLDARYTAKDVLHSFHTKFGETIDCIDFFAQPGVKALAAEGHPITTLPPPPPSDIDYGPLADVAFTGRPDDQGRPRACPSGAVPLLRITAADISRAGGLDAFRRAHALKGTPAQPVPPDNAVQPSAAVGPDIKYYAHVRADSAYAPVLRGQSTISLFDPYVPPSGGHSLSQVWMADTSGSAVQTVEAGVNVDWGLNGDGALHLFIESTNDGYKTGCIDDFPNVGPCLKWVATPQAGFTPGQMLKPGDPLTTTGTPPGVTQSITVEVIQQGSFDNGFFPDHWTIRVNGQSIGYYPDADFYGAMQYQATVFRIGGEVFDPSSLWVTPMGSGASPNASYGQAAWQDGYIACSAIAQNGTPTNCSSTFTTPSVFGSAAYAVYQPTPTFNLFFFGDAPNAFDYADWAENNAPKGDWASGDFKGNCPLGQPLDGLSRYTSVPAAPWSHAVHCSPYGSFPGPDQPLCYARTVNPWDSRGTNDNNWDWDLSSYKTECAANEYVQGVSQDPSTGHLHSIDCCPANVSHLKCSTQVFYSSDSSAYSGTDWDPGYYKGQCPLGQYVAGISTPANSSVGIYGAAHAILCCSP